MQLFTSSVDASVGEAGSNELELRVKQTRERASHEMLPNSMLFGFLAASSIVWVLWDQVSHAILLTWLSLRLLINVTRFGHVQWSASCAFELMAQHHVGDDGLDAHARSVL